MDASLETLIKILKREIGLDASTIGEATIRKFLGQRMRACKIDKTEDYYDLLKSDRDELAALLETAVIPETWFFRDTRPFIQIAQALKTNTNKYANARCNILSIPCSTGEEPYSIAMYLLQAGIAASSFHIKAVDISRHALDIALQGSYGSNSFRGKTDKQYIDRYFTGGDNQYVINDIVRQCVTFSRVNILDAGNLPDNQYFDFILCRNLLIYFDVNTKLTAFRNIHRLLKDDGSLFIGHSEFGAVPRNLFTNTGADNAFALIKFVAKEPVKPSKSLPHKPQIINPAVTVRSPVSDTTTTKPATTASRPAPQVASPEKTTHALSATNENENLLEHAQKLADAGQLHDAENYCIRHIDKNGDDAESLFLLALINDAAGKKDMAETFFRKAIYLEPKHYQSLIHLALLLETRGDRKAANLFRQRADRVLKK